MTGEREGQPHIRDVAQRWEVADSVRRFDGSLISVRTDSVRMPDGAVADRDVVEHPGAVGVLALDGADRVLLVRQYRHPTGHCLWEAPAGLRDVDGEEPRDTARRELYEEAGYLARHWHTLVDGYTSPGMCDERIRIYLARGLTQVADEQRFVGVHEETDMPIGWLDLDDAVGRVLAGHLHNPMAVMGILAAYAARADGFRRLRPADAPED